MEETSVIQLELEKVFGGTGLHLEVELKSVSFTMTATVDFNLRPLTPGKRFLLFLPDSHSAYYDSVVSALGRSLPPPPHWVFQDLLYLVQFLAETVATLGKMALGTSVGFLGIGQSD